MHQDGVAISAEEGGAPLIWPHRSVIDAGLDPEGAAILRHGDAWLLIPAEAAPLLLAGGGQRRWPGIGWIGPLGLLGAAIVAAVLLVPDLLVHLVPPPLERALGGEIEPILLADKPPCSGAAGIQAVRALTHRLALAAGADPDTRVTVADAPTVNAFTLPGARIVVMRGLIDRVEDGDEFAGVLAHEMGHVAHRDPARLLLQQVGLGNLASLFGIGGNGGGVAELSRLLVILSNSRAAETSADAAALDYLGRLGLRQDGLTRFLASLTADHAGLAAGWLATHPANAQRIEATRRATTGSPAFTAKEWSAVRHACG